MLAAEVAQSTQALTQGGAALDMDGGRARCPLCPFRSFAGRPNQMHSAILHHLRMYHVPKDESKPRLRDFAPGGSKHAKIIKALWDFDTASGCRSKDLLRRCATLLRANARPFKSQRTNRFTEEVAFVLDEDGPMYLEREIVHNNVEYRRCGYTYYTRAFAERFLREALLAHGPWPHEASAGSSVARFHGRRLGARISAAG